jgi:hypothetical protein
MPYIETEAREALQGSLDQLINSLGGRDGSWLEGEVNYVFCKILYTWWKHRERYSRAVDIMGTLSCVAQEFYRRVIVPYEDGAAEINGDVFDE